MIANHPTVFSMRITILLLCAVFTFAFTGCTHEPEIATPPADSTQQTQPSTSQNKDDASADDAEDLQTNDDATDSAANAGDTKQAESDNTGKNAAAHEGPFVISILNAGGADGLAGKAQEMLSAGGIAGDGYSISVDSYLGGTIPATTIYVSGEGDDAEAVKAEADKIAAALGGTVKTFESGELVEGTTMNGLDVLILVGADAV